MGGGGGTRPSPLHCMVVLRPDSHPSTTRFLCPGSRLQALGMKVEMPGGLGILVPEPLTGPEQVASRLPASINVKEKLSHVIAAVGLIKAELKGKV